MRYAALLRGVNVGGRKVLAMDALRAAFEGMGFTNVRTIQASGNVLFDVGDEDAPARGEDALGGGGEASTRGKDASSRWAAEILLLADRIEETLEQTFGYPIGVIVRRLADIQRLVASDPFRGLAVGPETRLYATFLSRPPESAPETAPDVHLQMFTPTGGEVLTAITLSPGWGTTELMAWLEKHFGTDVTTRNWNTVLKIAGT